MILRPERAQLYSVVPFSRFDVPVVETWWRAAGATDPVAAYQPKGASSQANSYINLANPGTYNLSAPGNAPTWDATNGLKFNGSNQYLTTGVAPETDQTWSMIVRFSNVTSDGTLVGAGRPEYTIQLSARFNSNSIRVYSNGGVSSVTPAGGVTAGVMCVAGRSCYLDGVSEGTIAVGTAAVVMPVIYVGSRQYISSPQLYQAGYVQALAIYDYTLTGAQVAAVTAAMQKL